MSINRRAAKRDANESAIVEALEAVGASVHRLSGGAIPDLLVGFRGETYLLEVKDKRGRLTPAQKKARETWQGAPWITVKTLEAALSAIGATNATDDR